MGKKSVSFSPDVEYNSSEESDDSDDENFSPASKITSMEEKLPSSVVEGYIETSIQGRWSAIQESLPVIIPCF